MKTLVTLLMIALCGYTVALNPSRTYNQRPEKFNMAYQEIKVATNDGEAELKAWHFNSKGVNSKLVLIAHNGEGNMADYLRRVDAFQSLGYNVVIFDYRGYGESSEFEIDNNMYIYPHFQDDLVSMIDYCRKYINAEINLYGWGVGAGLSLGIGYNRPEVQRIIADTPFFSMEDLENRFSSWDEPMEVPFAGYEKRFEPIYALDLEPSKNLKISLIIGSNDLLYSIEDMKKLQQKRPKIIDRNIFVAENPDRKDNFMINKEGYLAYLKTALTN